MRVLLTLALSSIALLVASCSSPPASKPTEAVPRLDQATILGRWDRIKSDTPAISWKSLAPNLKTENSLGLEFRREGQVYLLEEAIPGLEAMNAHYDLANDGTLSFVMNAPKGTALTRFTLKAALDGKEMILTAADGRMDRYRRGEAVDPISFVPRK